MVASFFTNDLNKVAILGEGITARSVRACIHRLPGFLEVSVSEADLIVASPGIPSDQYPETDQEIISEPEFAYRLFHRPDSRYTPKIIAITGTNGKSTVTAMLAAYLNAPALGNIGIPMVSLVDRPQVSDYIVVELSSYQLDGNRYFKPELALLLNITEDHLSRYASMRDYAISKQRLFYAMDNSSLVIYNSDCQTTVSIMSECLAKTLAISDSDISEDIRNVSPQIALHHQLNALFVKTAVTFLQGTVPDMTNFLSQFQFLEHRCETVATVDRRLFINDSKSTNPDATIKAIRSFDGPIHLLLCGVNKGLDMTPLLEVIDSRIDSLIIFGDLRHYLLPLLKQRNCSVPFFDCDDIFSAFDIALRVSKPLSSVDLSASDYDAIVLLSPASASFDQFDDFEHRGHVFKELVHQLKERLDG